MKKCLIFLSAVIIMAISACDSLPDNFQDKTVVPLQEQINTMQDAYEFVLNRVNEWGVKAVKPQMISVFFVGNQIEDQRGIMEYSFTADNGKDNYLAEVTVTIDMETANLTLFDVCFDPRAKGGTKAEDWKLIKTMDISKWTLTLDEAFEIIYKTLGNDAFSRFENPQISLSCFSGIWTFRVTKENENVFPTGVRHGISINPITKQIIEIKGFEDNEL